MSRGYKGGQMLVPDHSDHRMVEGGEDKNEFANIRQSNVTRIGSSTESLGSRSTDDSGSTTKPDRRPEREEIFMEVAKQFARRSTCLRKSVGACLVRDNHILGTGYNGAPRMDASCDRVGCLLESNHCVRTVHAEVNAILSAAYSGVSTSDSTLYTTAKPCFRCEAFLINAGVTNVIYLEDYDDGHNNRLQESELTDIRRYGDVERSTKRQDNKQL